MRSCRKMSVGRGWLHHSDLFPRGGVENVMAASADAFPGQTRTSAVSSALLSLTVWAQELDLGRRGEAHP